MSWPDMSADEKIGAIYRLASRQNMNSRQIMEALGAPSVQAVMQVAIRNRISLTRTPKGPKPKDMGLPRRSVPFWHLPPNKQREAIIDRAARAAKEERIG